MKIFRVRKTYGYKGYPNFYDHADVITENEDEVWLALKEKRVYNWRRIDEFDVAKEDYCYYTMFGEISEKQAKKPQRPLPAIYR